MRLFHERVSVMNRDRLRLLAFLLSVSMTVGAVSSAPVYAEEMETTVVEQSQGGQENPSAPVEQTAGGSESSPETAGNTGDADGGETTESSDSTESTQENTDPTDETDSSHETDPAQETDPSNETDPTQETDPSTEETGGSSDETDGPTDETEEPTDETEDPTDETEDPSEEACYPWDEMDDEEFAAFIREEQYLPYTGDEEAAVSLLERADRIEDPLLRDELCTILIAWLFPEEETESDTYALGDAGPVSLEELNSPEMFFKQEMRGTCTLAANAMLVRRAARLNGYANWRSITESALKGTAWVEGIGMVWEYSYAGITVGHGTFSNCTVDSLRAFLKQHPEGFVAFKASSPSHAVLITDYDESTGIFYCADPGNSSCRAPLSNSVLYQGSQEATIAAFTAYWVVTSPKLSLAPSLPPLAQREITVTARFDDSGVHLNWNDTLGAGYWIYRSESPNGPWETTLHSVPSGTVAWTDETAQMGVTYYYCVRSYDAQGGKGYLSKPVECTPDRQVPQMGKGKCSENIRWIAYEDGLLLVMGTGKLPDYSNEVEEPWLSIRHKIKEIRLSDGITYIGSSNFGGMENLTRVNLPDSVTAIGNWAFLGCSSLTEINMPGVTSIGYATFRRCNGLTEIEIPSAVSSIGDWAFSKCNNLRRIVLPASLKQIGLAVFYEDVALESVEIPNGVTFIGGHAFRGCTSLRSVSIPSSVNRLDSYAFALCSSLGDLDLSGCLVGLSIGEGAFFNCTSITHLRLPACQVDTKAFAYCYGLQNIVLEGWGAVVNLGSEAFNYCVSLRRVLAVCRNVNVADNTFQNTYAHVLVNANVYGYLDTMRGGCHWSSYRGAGLCSSHVQWYIDSNWNLVLYGSGEIPSYSASKSPWNGSNIQMVTVERGITGVGDYAFHNLPLLQKITFQGSAPSFAGNALAGVKGTVLYHNTDGSWTGKAGSALGGAPVWRENHGYSWKLTKAPGFTSGGELAGTCASCGSSVTVQVPKLDRESYDCVETATTVRYTWKVSDYGTICFEVKNVTIQTQPTSVTVGEGAQARFTMGASGNSLSYQWQRQNPGSNQWSVCGGNSSVLTLDKVSPEDSGAKFRCTVTDGNGKSATSEVATLTVN